MENVPTVQKHVDNLGAQISTLQKVLNPIIHGVVPETLTPLEQAQHYALLAYALDSIIFAHLKSTGTDHKGHPIMLELERIKASMAKIKRVQDGMSSEQDLESKQHSNSKIDKEAAARFIKHAIGSQASNTAGSTNKPNPDEYLMKMAKATEKSLKAKENPIELSSDDDSEPNQASAQPPAKDKTKKRRKEKDSSGSKKKKF